MFVRSSHQIIRYSVLFALLIIALGNDSDMEDDDHEDMKARVKPLRDEGELPPNMEKLTFKAADLTEEDQHSGHMPQDLMCDGCKVIAYLATKALQKVQSRFHKRKGYRLSESDLIDLFDGVCNNKEVFNGYGVKEVKGKKRLSGDGLDTKDAPGILSGGGKWPHRLQEMCQQYVGHLGEHAIYASFLKEESVLKLLCFSKENGSVCLPKMKIKTSKSKEEF